MRRSCDDARAVVAIGANGVGVDEDVLDGLLSGDGGSDGEEGVHCGGGGIGSVGASEEDGSIVCAVSEAQTGSGSRL